MAVGSSTAQTANAQAALRLTSSFPECNSITKFSMPLAFRNYKANMDWSRNRNNENKFWKFLYCMASICTCDGYKKAYLWSRICITNKSSNCQGWLGLYSCISNGLKFKNQTVIKNENKIHVQLNYTGYFILFTWTKNIKLLNTNRILFCPQNVPHFKILLTNLCLKRYNLCF